MCKFVSKGGDLSCKILVYMCSQIFEQVYGHFNTDGGTGFIPTGEALFRVLLSGVQGVVPMGGVEEEVCGIKVCSGRILPCFLQIVSRGKLT